MISRLFPLCQGTERRTVSGLLQTILDLKLSLFQIRKWLAHVVLTIVDYVNLEATDAEVHGLNLGNPFELQQSYVPPGSTPWDCAPCIRPPRAPVHRQAALRMKLKCSFALSAVIGFI